jgi:formate dehydrogenase
MSTGVNMGPFGSVAYWLLQGLNLLTGNVDRAGGLRIPRGAFDTFALARALGLGTFDDHRTLQGDWHRVAGAFPVSALAGEIKSHHPERIRALFVSAGNPLHSVPAGGSGEGSLSDAFGELELLVSIDMYRNESAARADYILPATDMLERSDFPVSHIALQPKPYAQFTEAVVAPLYERRPEAWIFSQLALACGASPLGASVCNALPHLNRLLEKLPGGPQLRGDHLLALALRAGGRTTLAELKRNPSGVVLAEEAPGWFLGKRVPTENGLVNLAPQRVLADLARLAAAGAEHESFSTSTKVIDSDTLYLIGRRDRRSHNSWMHNNPRIQQPAQNVAIMHPEDAHARGLEQGDEVCIGADEEGVRVPIRVSDEVAPGVIAVPHGWGHAGTGVPRAAALGGANINHAVPGGQAQMEPVSGQAIMLAHRVRVRRAVP